jgi:cytoskeletal protein RodZ
MPAPTLDRNPRTSTRTGTTAGRRRNRKRLALVASALVVLAVAGGTSLAIAGRPVAPQATTDPPAAAVAAADDQNANADQGTAAQPGQATQAGIATKPDTGTNSSSGTDSSGSDTPAAALPDGTHTAYITEVDQVNHRIVVDVVQVFEGDQAVKEAIADGKPRPEAQYLTTWVRNVNPRLRTLPLASGVVVKLWNACEENGSGHNPLTMLSANARQKGTYYYTLTVSHGKVQRIQEQLAINAC